MDWDYVQCSLVETLFFRSAWKPSLECVFAGGAGRIVRFLSLPVRRPAEVTPAAARLSRGRPSSPGRLHCDGVAALGCQRDSRDLAGTSETGPRS
jgi:hypothetical protein